MFAQQQTGQGPAEGPLFWRWSSGHHQASWAIIIIIIIVVGLSRLVPLEGALDGAQPQKDEWRGMTDAGHGSFGGASGAWWWRLARVGLAWNPSSAPKIGRAQI